MPDSHHIPIAHIRKSDETTQPLIDHLEEVGELAASFAQKINAAEAGRAIGLLHDFGKFSHAFQCYINSAGEFIQPDEDDYVDAKSHKGKIDHSSAGAQYIWTKLSKFGNRGQGELVAQILALCIASHHSGLIDCIDKAAKNTFKARIDKDDDKTHFLECCEKITPDLHEALETLINQNLVKSLFKQLRTIITFPKKIDDPLSKTDAFSLGVFTRFLFSCLIDGDRLNSAEFEMPSKKEQRLSRQAWLNWDIAIKRCEQKICSFKQKFPIDSIRKQISDHCKQRAFDAQGVYSLTVPTGGGKTLASLRYALHHAKHHKLERIIYIIPYTSIIEQNAQSIREVLEENSDLHPWVLEHHSNLEPENQTWHTKLVSENWDAPIVFTTMVQFLETLFSGGTRSVRRMHQLANAVLIFDEIQTLPINCIHLFCNALNFLTQHAKTTAILCTATQPVLDKLHFKDKGQLTMSENHELIGDTDHVQQLFNDLNRVTITNKLKIGGWHCEDIKQLIWERLDEFGSCLVIVNTKSWAQRLYQSCIDWTKNNELPPEAIFHLSTNLYPAHRKAKLEAIKKRLSLKLPVICISTQLIEAGVDVSFGAVIRFLAGLDSIAQAAGRCNRHGELKDRQDRVIKGQVDIINPDTESIEFLADISAGKRHTQRVLDEVEENELLSPSIIHRYFRYYFYDRRDVMDYLITDKDHSPEQTLFNLLSTNSLNGNTNTKPDRPNRLGLMRHSFQEVGRLFKAIDAPTRAVIVQHEKGITLVAELCRLALEFEPQAYYQTLKEAQQYSVNLFPNVWKKLEDAGAIHETQPGEGVFFLDSDHYDNDFGVTDQPTANMICGMI